MANKNKLKNKKGTKGKIGQIENTQTDNRFMLSHIQIHIKNKLPK